MHHSEYELYKSYAETLLRISEQGENFDRSEALDFLSRLYPSVITGRPREDMTANVVRAANTFELDDEATNDLATTLLYLDEYKGT